VKIGETTLSRHIIASAFLARLGEHSAAGYIRSGMANLIEVIEVLFSAWL